MSAGHGQMVSDFRSAAQVIRTGGLAKHSYVTLGGEHCAVGALRVVQNGTMANHDPLRTYVELVTLSELLGGPMQPCDCGGPYCRVDGAGVAPFDVVTNWNDAEERTADDVATLLEQAAEKLEADL